MASTGLTLWHILKLTHHKAALDWEQSLSMIILFIEHIPGFMQLMLNY